MRNLRALLSVSFLSLAACSGDDTSGGSMGSGGTDSGSCLGVDSIGPRGTDECPATDTVTDTAGSDSNSGSATDGTSATDSTATAGTGGTGGTTATTDTAGTGMTTDTATTGMTSDTATTGIDQCETGCEFDVTFTVTEDECSHESFIALGPTETVRVTVSGGDITIEILGDPGLDPIMGTIDGNGAFTATGTATVANMPGISVEITGSITGTSFAATVTFGVDGDLPGGCPMVATMVGDIG